MRTATRPAIAAATAPTASTTWPTGVATSPRIDVVSEVAMLTSLIAENTPASARATLRILGARSAICLW